MEPTLHLCKMKGLSGCEKQLLALLPALRSRGWDVRLMILEELRLPMECLAARFEAAGVPTERLVMSRHGGTGLVAHLARRFRQIRASLVHTHLIHADMAGTLAARLAGVPHLVSTRHGTHPFYTRTPFHEIDVVAARLCDRGVAISEFAREFFIANGTFRRERLRTIYYGIDGAQPGAHERWRECSRLRGEETVVGVIARLVPGKGHEVFLEAIALLERQLSGRELRYWIVGDGPEQARLRRRAMELGFADRVRFWGFQEDVGSLLAAVDIVCVPTSPRFGEGLNLVLLEAGLAGRPVVASRTGPIPEVVVDGETGLLVEPDNPAHFADALRRLAVDERMRATLGAAAQRRVREHFSLARAVAGHEQLYMELGLAPARELASHAPGA